VVILVLISILMFVGLNAIALHKITQSNTKPGFLDTNEPLTDKYKKYLKSINNIDDNDINIKILYKKMNH